MPTYQYRCRNCNHEFEVKQRMSDDPLTACPVCEGSIRRVVSPVSVVFKGSGFYVTDHRSGSNGSNNNTKTKEKEGSSESKSEEKPSSKAETKETSNKSESSNKSVKPEKSK